MTTYSIRPFGRGYIVVRTDPGTIRQFYLRSMRGAASIWYTDPLYARQYSLRTAQRHLRDLQASDLAAEQTT